MSSIENESNLRDYYNILRFAGGAGKLNLELIDFINDYESLMTRGVNFEKGEPSAEHEALKLLERVFKKSGLLEGMIDFQNKKKLSSFVYKQLGQRLFAIPNSKIDKIIDADSYYSEGSSIDIISIMGKKAFYSNKLAKFVEATKGSVLRKNGIRESNNLFMAISDSIPRVNCRYG